MKIKIGSIFLKIPSIERIHMRVCFVIGRELNPREKEKWSWDGCD